MFSVYDRDLLLPVSGNVFFLCALMPLCSLVIFRMIFCVCESLRQCACDMYQLV